MPHEKKYTVTFCAMDQKVGSNFFWHSLLLLSELDTHQQKMKVVDHYGYYGMPSTDRNSYLSHFKIKLGLDIDLYGNHGMLRHEDVRALDAGQGLHGVTFELTREKFEALQQRCKAMINDQENAIHEKLQPLKLPGELAKKPRIYPYEHLSSHIYALEKEKAEQHHHEPRLKPFEFNLSLTLWGPTLKGSYTCKTQALKLLDGILTKEQIARLSENDKHPNIPRYSGKMEEILLHSSGPLREHRKRSGQTVYYRDWKDEDVELHWTLPPQEYEVLSEDTANLFKLSKDYCNEAKSIASKLQRLEWLFINAEIPRTYQLYKEGLIARIRSCYQSFAVIEPKIKHTDLNSWSSYALSWLNLPKNRDEEKLFHKITQGKNLVNSLYMAIVDAWEIDENYPCEQEDHQELSANEDLSEEVYSNPLEAVAAYLSPEDKQQLCVIIGRPYLEPEQEESLSASF